MEKTTTENENLKSNLRVEKMSSKQTVHPQVIRDNKNDRFT